MKKISITSCTHYNTDKFNSGAEYMERYPGDDFIDILGFDIYQAGALQDKCAFMAFFNNGPGYD